MFNNSISTKFCVKDRNSNFSPPWISLSLEMCYEPFTKFIISVFINMNNLRYTDDTSLCQKVKKS